MGLGSVEFVTLAQARERAFELRRQLKDRGIDPLERAGPPWSGRALLRSSGAPSRRWLGSTSRCGPRNGRATARAASGFRR